MNINTGKLNIITETDITIQFRTFFYWELLFTSLFLVSFLRTGINEKNGKPYTNRLYSIASTRYGDDMKVDMIKHC
jgi:hypothetical protein